MQGARHTRPFWGILGLVLGFAVVLAAPVAYFTDSFAGYSWGDGPLKADFQSIRYESGGLIFRYAVRNTTRRAAQFQPGLSEIHMLQTKEHPAIGYPNISLPLSVPARGLRVVEVRLELPSFSRSSPTLSSDDQTRRVLESPPPGAPLIPDAPVSPLPMRGPAHPAPDPVPVEFSLQDALTDLNGFELVDETNGTRLVLPRGW